MYELWKEKHITFPSEFWNASEGDKIALKAFHDYEIQEKNKKIMQMCGDKIPIYPIIAV